MVTAEAAVTIPALVLVLALCWGQSRAPSTGSGASMGFGPGLGRRRAVTRRRRCMLRSPPGHPRAHGSVCRSARAARVTVATTARAPWSALGVEGCRERAELTLESADPP